MMVLFLLGMLLLICGILFLQFRYVHSFHKKRLYHGFIMYSFACVMLIIIRFSGQFYHIEEEGIRKFVMYASTCALFWFVIFSVVALIACVLQRKRHYLRISTLLSVSAALTLSLTCFGIWQTSVIEEREYTLSLKKEMKQDLTIGFLSDLHLGSGCDREEVTQLFATLREMKIDVLFISGDLFDESTPKDILQYFCEQSATLRLRDGIYYVSGNHEFLQEQRNVYETIMEIHQIHILRDEVVLIRDTYYIAGRLDKSQERLSLKTLCKDIDIQKPLFVLDHRPNFDDEGKDIIDLQLSGHTHAGQIFPNTVLTKIAYPYDYGYYAKPYSMIVTSGYGTWGLPLRIGSEAEIVTIHVCLSDHDKVLARISSPLGGEVTGHQEFT